MRKSYLIVSVIILLSFAVGAYFYPQLPEKMASHWNAQGEVDDYMSKFWGTFLTPIIILAMFLLFVLIPKIDPLKENIEKFRKYFDAFIVLISIFLFYLFILVIVWNLGKTFNFTVFLIPAFGILFYYAGILVENAKRNWFVGIRTPWTLASEIVWDKTHQLGGKLFKIAALISFLGIIFSKYALFFVLIPIISVSLYTILYSYWQYQKTERK